MTAYPAPDDDFGHWLAGFIDGEGCFAIAKPASYWVPRFEVKLRDDDRPLLEEIVRRTALGAVYAVPVSRRMVRGANPAAAWRVTRKEDAMQLVRLLDRYPLRSKKMLDYLLWREAVVHWVSVVRCGGRRGADWGPIPVLATELVQVRKYARRSPQEAAWKAING